MEEEPTPCGKGFSTPSRTLMRISMAPRMKRPVGVANPDRHSSWRLWPWIAGSGPAMTCSGCGVNGAAVRNIGSAGYLAWNIGSTQALVVRAPGALLRHQLHLGVSSFSSSPRQAGMTGRARRITGKEATSRARKAPCGKGFLTPSRAFMRIRAWLQG